MLQVTTFAIIAALWGASVVLLPMDTGRSIVPEAAQAATLTAAAPAPKESKPGNEQQGRILITDEGFQPNRLQVTKGVPLRLEIRNLTDAAHTFVLPEYHIYSFILHKGQAVVFQFTPDRAGIFQFYSDAGGRSDGPEGRMLIR